MEQSDPVIFVIWDQVTRKMKKAHVNNLEFVEIKEWDISTFDELDLIQRKKKNDVPWEIDDPLQFGRVGLWSIINETEEEENAKRKREMWKYWNILLKDEKEQK